MQNNAILILGYWQKSELMRSGRQTWLNHSSHTEFDFATQTAVHTEPQTHTLLPLKDSAPAQQTHHLLSCWDVGLQPARSPAHALLLGAYHLIKNNTDLGDQASDAHRAALLSLQPPCLPRVGV